MPIENVTPYGLDSLLSNRAKKSLYSKKNKHLQSLTKMPKIDRMTHFLDMSVLSVDEGGSLKQLHRSRHL